MLDQTEIGIEDQVVFFLDKKSNRMSFMSVQGDASLVKDCSCSYGDVISPVGQGF